MTPKRAILLAFILVLGLSGCTSVGKVMPANDRVLLYPLPYDLTYLRTLEALDSQKDWELQETEKEEGLIRVRNMNYSRLDDSDKCVIAFAVKRVDFGKTSVSIQPKDQHVPGGDQLLTVIGEYLAREIRN